MKVLCLHEICMVSGAGTGEYQCDCPDCPNYVTPEEMERMKEEQRRAEEEARRRAEQDSCSWGNFGKSIAQGAVGGGVSGAVAGSFAPAVGTAIGGATGAVGGAIGGGAVHLATCWW